MSFGFEFSLLWHSWRKVGANEIKDQMQQDEFGSVRDFSYQKSDYKTKYFLEEYHTAQSCLNLLFLCISLPFQRSTTYWIHELQLSLWCLIPLLFTNRSSTSLGVWACKPVFYVTKKEVWSSLLHTGTVLRDVSNPKMVQPIHCWCPGTWKTTKDSCERRRRLPTPKMHLY